MAGMTWSVSRDNHLFVYWRGELIWKRWDDRGYSALFEAGRPPRNMVEENEDDAIWAELEANPDWLDHVAELRDRAIDAHRAGETESMNDLMRPNLIHVFPPGLARDDDDHARSEDCPCGPRVEPTVANEGGIPLGYIVWHQPIIPAGSPDPDR